MFFFSFDRIISPSHFSTKTPPGGNYDTYVRTRAELEEAQMKKYRCEK